MFHLVVILLDWHFLRVFERVSKCSDSYVIPMVSNNIFSLDHLNISKNRASDFKTVHMTRIPNLSSIDSPCIVQEQLAFMKCFDTNAFCLLLFPFLIKSICKMSTWYIHVINCHQVINLILIKYNLIQANTWI